MKTDFTHPVEIDRIPRSGSTEKVIADVYECEILSQILKVPKVHAFRAVLTLTPMRGGGLKVEGKVTADLTLVSVISLEEFRSTETFDVERYFVKHRKDEDDDDVDIDILDGRTIDLAAIAIETVGLELDSYPRKPGEEYQVTIDPDEEEDVPKGAFSVLANLTKPKP